MKRRKLTALLLAGALAVGLMAAPVSVIVPDSAYEVVAASKASKEKAYGTPWINSNAYGNAKKVSKPSLKDDFYLNVNNNIQVIGSEFMNNWHDHSLYFFILM